MTDSIDILYNDYLETQLDLIFGIKEEVKIKREYPIIKKVEKNDMYSFVDASGNPITEEWFDKAYNFDNGYAVVKDKKKINLIDTEGNLISNEWFDEYNRVSEDLIEIVKGNKTYLYNVNNKSLSKDGYDDILSFNDGYAVVRNNKKYNFIDEDGKAISDVWFDDVNSFRDDFAIVKNNDKYNFINRDGRLLSKEWYDGIHNFNDGCALVKSHNKYNFLNTSGHIISPTWYRRARDFKDGFAVVENNKMENNYIDTNGNLLSKRWFNNAEDFEDGFGKVNYYDWIGEYNFYAINYINKNGKGMSHVFESAVKYNDSCIIGVTPYTEKKMFIDIHNGQTLYEGKKNEDYKLYRINNSFTTINDKVICTTQELKGYKVKKGLLNYVCEKDNDKFSLKYAPIRIYDNFVLCQKDRDIYLYNRKANTYDYLDKVDNIDFNDLIIHNRREGKEYLVYSNKVFDITDYYNKKIGYNDYSIEEGIPLYTKKEFIYNKDSILNEKHITKLKYTEDKRKEELKRKQKEEKEKVYDSLSKLDMLDRDRNTISRIYLGDILHQVDDHREIQDIYLKEGFLKHIDMSTLNFKNAKISGLDFSDCNLSFNPQEVYNKDLSNCNFERVHIGPFTNFNEVDIRGTKFSDDNDPTTMNTVNSSFKDALYDEDTTYNGKSFVELFGECELTKGKTK